MTTFDYAQEPLDGLRREALPQRERRMDWWPALALPTFVLALIGGWLAAGALIARGAVWLMDRVADLGPEQGFVGLVVVLIGCCVLAACTDPGEVPEDPGFDVR